MEEAEEKAEEGRRGPEGAGGTAAPSRRAGGVSARLCGLCRRDAGRGRALSLLLRAPERGPAPSSPRQHRPLRGHDGGGAPPPPAFSVRMRPGAAGSSHTHGQRDTEGRGNTWAYAHPYAIPSHSGG